MEPGSLFLPYNETRNRAQWQMCGGLMHRFLYALRKAIETYFVERLFLTKWGRAVAVFLWQYNE